MLLQVFGHRMLSVWHTQVTYNHIRPSKYKSPRYRPPNLSPPKMLTKHHKPIAYIWDFIVFDIAVKY